MKEFWNTIQLIFAAVGGWLGYFLGGCDGLLIALLIFVTCDYLTGIMCAIADKKLSSEVGFKGICRKVLIFLDLCQYFGHKKLNFFSLHSINTERKIIKLQEPHLQPAVGFYNPVHCASFCGYTKTQYIQRELF